MDYRVPTKYKMILTTIAVATTLLGYLSGNVDFGFLIGISLSVIILAAYVRRDLSCNFSYWILLIFWTLTHFVIITLINQRLPFHPSILVAPLFVVDYILVLGSLFLLPSSKE